MVALGAKARRPKWIEALQLAIMALLALGTMPAIAGLRPATPQKVDGPEISMLIRSTLVALHQANLTANYSVLRDLGDGQFQGAYSQAALSDMFRGFRSRGISLEPAVLYDADLDAPPKLTSDGLLRVVGHFPTAPEQIMFDITFRAEKGLWRIDAIDIGTRPVPLAPALTRAPPAQMTMAQPVSDAEPVPPLPPRTPQRPANMPGVIDLTAENPSFQ